MLQPNEFQQLPLCELVRPWTVHCRIFRVLEYDWPTKMTADIILISGTLAISGAHSLRLHIKNIINQASFEQLPAYSTLRTRSSQVALRHDTAGAFGCIVA